MSGRPYIIPEIAKELSYLPTKHVSKILRDIETKTKAEQKALFDRYEERISIIAEKEYYAKKTPETRQFLVAWTSVLPLLKLDDFEGYGGCGHEPNGKGGQLG